MKYLVSTLPQLSHALRDIRKSQSLSQDSTGKLVGLLPKTISVLENHPGSITLGSLLKLLSALDLELIISSKHGASGTVAPNSNEDW